MTKVIVSVQGGVVTAVDATEECEVIVLDHDDGGEPRWAWVGRVMEETWDLCAREADDHWSRPQWMRAEVEGSEQLERRAEIQQ